MKKNTFQIVIISEIAFVLLCVGAYLFFFYSIRTMRQDQIDLQKNQMTLQDSTSLLVINDINAKQLDAKSDEILSHVIKNGGEADFIASIESLCSSISLSCTMQSLEIIPGQSGVGPINTFHLGIEANGSFSGMVSLLQHLDDSSYLISISNVVLTSSKTDKGTSWMGNLDVMVPTFSQ